MVELFNKGAEFYQVKSGEASVGCRMAGRGKSQQPLNGWRVFGRPFSVRTVCTYASMLRNIHLNQSAASQQMIGHIIKVSNVSCLQDNKTKKFRRSELVNMPVPGSSLVNATTAL